MPLTVFFRARLSRSFWRVSSALSLLCWLHQFAAITYAQNPTPHASVNLSTLPWQGIVRYVTDGDTLWIAPQLSSPLSDLSKIDPNLPVAPVAPVRYARTARAIRIAQIDAPEHGQFYAAPARQLLQQLCLGKLAEVSPLTSDRYQRTVAQVKCAGVNVATVMVESGAAWVYRRYTSASELIALEQAARLAARGLWQQSAQKNPEAFRRAQVK